MTLSLSLSVACSLAMKGKTTRAPPSSTPYYWCTHSSAVSERHNCNFVLSKRGHFNHWLYNLFSFCLPLLKYWFLSFSLCLIFSDIIHCINLLLYFKLPWLNVNFLTAESTFSFIVLSPATLRLIGIRAPQNNCWPDEWTVVPPWGQERGLEVSNSSQEKKMDFFLQGACWELQTMYWELLNFSLH